jgi:type IV pilus assembly protein PilB
LEEVKEEHNRSGKPSRDPAGLRLSGHGQQLQLIANHLGTEVVQLSDRELTPEILSAVPADAARMYKCLPVAVMIPPCNWRWPTRSIPTTVDELAYVIRKEIVPVVADPAAIERAVSKYYGDSQSSVADILKELGQDNEIAAKRPKRPPPAQLPIWPTLANETPIIRFVNLVLFQAVQDRASDIHFEPFEDEFKIRYRVDGALYEMSPPPKHLALPVISRMKVMSNLDISERRLPQDGRISHCRSPGATSTCAFPPCRPNLANRSCCACWTARPSTWTSKPSACPRRADYVLEAIQQPNGIFVVTGPTGCGKTTTLYSCLRSINSIDSKLLTVEDPVEYDIEGIMQVAVNEAVGMTFGKALRAFLRQDPDIIMLGKCATWKLRRSPFRPRSPAIWC